MYIDVPSYTEAPRLSYHPPIEVLIIHPEPLAAVNLVNMLRNQDVPVKILAMLHSVETAVNYLTTHSDPDLLFINIEFKHLRGFDILAQVSTASPVIFTADTQDDLAKVFGYNCLSFLQNPVASAELKKAMAKFEKYYLPNIVYKSARENKHKHAVQPTYKTRFMIKRGTRLYSVETSRIAYFLVKDKLTYLKTKSSEEFVIDKGLEELEVQLDPHLFFRANRQIIVQYESVKQGINWFDGKLKLIVDPSPNQDIIISRLKANQFRKWLGQ